MDFRANGKSGIRRDLRTVGGGTSVKSGAKDNWIIAVFFIFSAMLVAVSAMLILPLDKISPLVILFCASLAGSFFSALVNIFMLKKRAKQSELLNLTKTKFLATVSHEIRTPLNAIIGLSQIQLKKKLSRDTQTALDKILQSGTTLLSIINDMLDISKIESDSFELKQIEYDVPSFINDTVQTNIVRVGSKPIKFQLEIDETLPSRLFGDEVRVKQIINNLLSNAFKYTRDGTVTLSIGWEKSIADGIFLLITVSDTGIGIRQDDLQKLYSEYAQFDKIENRKIEGMGLGLTIVKTVVQMMSGTMTVQSEYGKGSDFCVRLLQKVVSFTPLGKDLVEKLKSSRYYNSKHDVTKNFQRAYMPYARTLVVDDVPTNLDVAAGLLEPYGMHVDCVLSGQSAVDYVRKGIKYDVIFMDHMMPEMDGMEAVRIIRNVIASDYAKNVPIVALTANAIAGNEEMFLKNGFSGFISKPIDIRELDAVVNKFVRDKQSKETLAAAKNAGGYRTLRTDADVRIEGVDVESGAAHYPSPESYFRVLHTYAKTTAELLNSFQEISPETLAQYAVNVHGLKSASYGIFAQDIGKQAEELEMLAKAGDYDAVCEKNTGFIEETKKLLNNIDGFFDAGAETESAEKTECEEIDAALLRRMLDASKKFDSIALEKTLDEIERFAYNDFANAELAVFLRKQVDELEYEKINETLERLL
jgi:signal transduction histidine kinase/DNA-binding response OmpR family regulator